MALVPMQTGVRFETYGVEYEGRGEGHMLMEYGQRIALPSGRQLELHFERNPDGHYQATLDGRPTRVTEVNQPDQLPDGSVGFSPSTATGEGSPFTSHRSYSCGAPDYTRHDAPHDGVPCPREERIECEDKTYIFSYSDWVWDKKESDDDPPVHAFRVELRIPEEEEDFPAIASTKESMRSVSLAVMSYVIDEGYAPPVATIQELKDLLQPRYIDDMPLMDAWGEELRYYSDPDAVLHDPEGNIVWASPNFWLVSSFAGRPPLTVLDGAFLDPEQVGAVMIEHDSEWVRKTAAAFLAADRQGG